MPRQESPNLIEYEVYLIEIGSIKAYARNILELAQLLRRSDRDVADTIGMNADLILEKAELALATHREFADELGYKYIRPELKEVHIT